MKPKHQRHLNNINPCFVGLKQIHSCISHTTFKDFVSLEISSIIKITYSYKLFQAEIGSISSDIKILQEKSMDMGLKLKNRKVQQLNENLCFMLMLAWDLLCERRLFTHHLISHSPQFYILYVCVPVMCTCVCMVLFVLHISNKRVIASFGSFLFIIYQYVYILLFE